MTKSHLLSALFTLGACVDQNVVDTPAIDDPESVPSEQEGGWYTGTFHFAGATRTVRYQVVGGERMFEGDISLGRAGTPRSNTVNDSSNRWPNARIPFQIKQDTWAAADFPSMKAAIDAAIANWNAISRIQFVPEPDCQNHNCVFIVGDSTDGCFSDIGYSIFDRHVHLPAGCQGTAAHELGHVIGLLHEHSRTDRDDHITTHVENTDKDDQFFHSSGNDTLGDYDFRSVMHYNAFAFTTNGRMTITRNDSWGLWGANRTQWRTGVTERPQDLLVGDFDGDGHDDVVRLTGTYWDLSRSAQGDWTHLVTSGMTSTANLRVGQFDNDARADIVYANGSEWFYKSGGTGSWISLRVAGDKFTTMTIVDYNGDGYSDFFRILGTDWQVSRNGRTTWQHLRTNDRVMALAELRFGNFVGDARTDMIRKTGNMIEVSDGGVGPWQPLHSSSAALEDLLVLDVNGDGTSDLLVISHKPDDAAYGMYKYSLGGSGPWTAWNGGGVAALDEVVAGNFRTASDELLVKGFYADPSRTPTDGDRGGVSHIYFSTVVLSRGGRNHWQYWDDDAPAQSLSTYQIGDFDGDGRDDLFGIVGADGIYSMRYRTMNPADPKADNAWHSLNSTTIAPDQIALGHFFNDPFAPHQQMDVFRKTGDRWEVAAGGLGAWTTINTQTAPMSQLGFADFNGDGITDVLYTTGSEWLVSYSGTAPFTHLNNSGVTMPSLRLGDFDGDGRADVVRSTGTQWQISSGGTAGWALLKTETADIKALRFGHFDGAAGLDVFRVNGTAWEISSGGSGAWTTIANSTIPAAALALGDFDGALDGQTDVIGVSTALTEDDANGW